MPPSPPPPPPPPPTIDSHHGSVCILLGVEVDKGVVSDLLDALHCSVLREDLLYLGFSGGEHQVTHIEDLDLSWGGGEGREGGREGDNT